MTLTYDLDLWPWKSIGCQIFVSITWVPSLVEIHWTMLTKKCYGRTDRCWQGDNCIKFGQNPLKDVDSRVFTRMIRGKTLTLWSWKSIGFQIFLRTKYVPSLVKIHWKMLILETLWPWKSIGFHTLLRTKYVPSLVKIHWNMLILECSQGCYVVKIWPIDLENQ